MSSGRKIISGLLAGLLLVVVLAAAYLGYVYLIYPGKTPYHAIPGDASGIIQINQPGEIIKELESGNKFWAGLKKSPALEEFYSEFSGIDSLTSENAFPGTGPVLLVLHDIRDRSPAVVLVTKLQSKKNEKQWIDFIHSIYPHETGSSILPFHISGLTGSAISEFSLKGGKKIYYTISHGLLIISGRPGQLAIYEATLRKNEGIINDPVFARLLNTAGTRVDANIFFRPSVVPLLTEAFLNERTKGLMAYLQDFSSWSGLDLMLKDDELMFSGYTDPGGSGKYLSSLANQIPKEITIDKVLPYNTLSLLWLGLNEASDYLGSYKDYLYSLQDSGKNISLLPNLMLPFDPGNNLELGLVKTWPLHRGASPNRYMLIKDDRQNKISEALGRNSDNRYHGSYKGISIRKAGSVEPEPPEVTDLVFDVTGMYYAKVSEYFVFSDELAAMQFFLNNYINGKTLDVSENYKLFSGDVSRESNIYFYANLRYAANELGIYLDSERTSDLTEELPLIGDLQGLAIQYSRLDNMFFTNFYIRYSEDYREEDLSLWKVQLESNIHARPFLIYDHREDKQKVIIFDSKNSMYMIDHNGNVIWKILLEEPPVSQVYQVDYYKNGKIQYLFNTRNYIYLIDLLGRNVGNFPIRINKEATSGLAVFDYSNHKDYRLLIPAKDNRVYNYELDGNPVEGWTNPKMTHPVVRPPQHLVYGNRDYILITDEKGEVLITDRRGNSRIKLRDNFVKATNSAFHVNRTNNKGIFITTDIKGHLTYIAASGKLSKTVFGDFSPDHYFLYSDFNKNGYRDFIFIDKNKLVVYDRFKKVIFDHRFDENITAEPKIFESTSGEKLLGVVLGNSSQLYLFNQDGDILISSGLVGQTPFTVGSLKQDGKLNLLVGADDLLYNYILE